MKEFTLIKPEHLLNGECFYAEKYPKGKATAHWAMKKNQHTLKDCQVTNINDYIIIISRYYVW